MEAHLPVSSIFTLFVFPFSRCERHPQRPIASCCATQASAPEWPSADKTHVLRVFCIVPESSGGESTAERRIPALELFVLSKVLWAKFEEFFPANLGGKIKALWPHYRVKFSRGQVPPVQ